MTSHKELPPELEKAVQTLLKPPHIYYLKELHAAAQGDASYIFNNESTVSTNVQNIFLTEGVQPDVMQQEWRRVLGIALHRIEEGLAA